MKKALHLMTWKEIETVFKNDPVIIIPMGSMEQHGPQSINGDYLAAEYIANKVAENTEGYVIPVIPFGCSEYFRPFPGTISLQPQTVNALITDVAESLIEHGITKLFFLNGHAGNVPTIEDVARKIKRDKKITPVSIDLWQALTPEFKKDVYQETPDPSGHGAEPLTSVMSYLHPEMMRMDLLGELGSLKQWGEFPVAGLKKSEINGAPMNLYLDMNEISAQGVMGSPLKASKERGEKIVTHLIEVCSEVVRKLAKTKTVK